jgi:hypothetical protein
VPLSNASVATRPRRCVRQQALSTASLTVLHDRRQSLTAKNAMAPCILRSCMRAARVETSLDPRESSTHTRQHAEHTVKLWTVSVCSSASGGAAKANKASHSFGDHADDIAMKCNTCGSFFSDRRATRRRRKRDRDHCGRVEQDRRNSAVLTTFSSEPLQTLWSAARTIRKDNNTSEPPPTRVVRQVPRSHAHRRSEL